MKRLALIVAAVSAIAVAAIGRHISLGDPGALFICSCTTRPWGLEHDPDCTLHERSRPADVKRTYHCGDCGRTYSAADVLIHLCTKENRS